MTPRSVPRLSALAIPPEYMDPSNFRLHPKGHKSLSISSTEPLARTIHVCRASTDETHRVSLEHSQVAPRHLFVAAANMNA
jgi:hypothetical protein